MSWLQNIVSKDASEKELVDYANTSYPILHERVLPLVHDFLQVIIQTRIVIDSTHVIICLSSVIVSSLKLQISSNKKSV